jgi:hypothetical protein
VTAVARCWTCDLDFTSADAWKLHDGWHQERGEVECLCCGELLPRRSLGFHPCASRLFSTVAHSPLNGETSPPRGLRLVSPSTKGNQP